MAAKPFLLRICSKYCNITASPSIGIKDTHASPFPPCSFRGAENPSALDPSRWSLYTGVFLSTLQRPHARSFAALLGATNNKSKTNTRTKPTQNGGISCTVCFEGSAAQPRKMARSLGCDKKAFRKTLPTPARRWKTVSLRQQGRSTTLALRKEDAATFSTLSHC